MRPVMNWQRDVAGRIRDAWRRFVRWWTTPRLLGVGLLILTLLIWLWGSRWIRADFYPNVITELASIAFTILIVNELYQYLEKEREKKRFILQMGSPDNAFAREAVRALRSYGWLYDGSLKGANLLRANLQRARLNDANLQGANLSEAKLQQAILHGVKLQGADLSVANLQKALLWDAKLQRAFLAWARLQGADLSGANLQQAILHDAKLEGAKYNDATIWPEGFTPPPEAVKVEA